MKFPLVSLAVLTASVTAQYEVEMIEAHMAPKSKATFDPGMCNAHELDPNMLIAKVRAGDKLHNLISVSFYPHELYLLHFLLF